MASKQPNPFRSSMVRMQAPPLGGPCISVRGFTMHADEDGAFEVPREVAEELRQHGFTEAPDVVEAVAPAASAESGKK